MSENVNKFGEPWTHTLPDDSNGFERLLTPIEYARAVACVNALAGVPDPEAYIASLRAENAALAASKEPPSGIAPAAWDAMVEKLARQDAEIESLRKSNQMFVQAVESWKKLHRAAVAALAKKMEENAALAERVKGASLCYSPDGCAGI